MKKIFFLGAMVCVLGIMAACKSGQQNGNTPKEYLSVADFSSDDIIVMGTYDELIAKGGFFKELVERQRLDAETLTE